MAKVVEEIIEFFEMIDFEKVLYASYLIRIDTKVWWQAFHNARWMDMIIWAESERPLRESFWDLIPYMLQHNSNLT